jgi:hypothetical protein
VVFVNALQQIAIGMVLFVKQYCPIIRELVTEILIVIEILFVKQVVFLVIAV